jgi:Cytochrome C oxidase, cbb3-type, subunit III
VKDVAILVAGVALAALTASTAGCRGEKSSDPPLSIERNMYDQERYNPQSYSHFFANHATMRPFVEGVVPQEGFEDDVSIATGLLPDGSGYVLTVPSAVASRFGGAEPMLERGRDRFNIFCAPCHGRTGDGKGMVARAPEGFPPLPTYTDPRICHLPDGQLFATITNGARLMPPYANQIAIADRWAVVSYVRALEQSQLAVKEGPKE